MSGDISDAVAAAPQLTVESLLAAASDKTGLTDFGDKSFLTPLIVLVNALVTEANLSVGGVYGQYQRILDLLINRLRVQDALKKHPEILEEKITNPVVIVGLPRTGTTMLHRIMASDSRFFAPLWYEVRNPALFPPDGELAWEPGSVSKDPRITDAENQVAVMLQLAPELLKIHPLDPIGADEEIMLLEHSFFSTTPPAFANVPSYTQWVQTHDNTPGYRYLKILLQYLQWQKKRAGQKAQRWLLKAPHHLHNMAELFAVFPDVKVILTHRDPLQTIPSISSFHFTLWKMAADNPDPVACGAQWSAMFARGMQMTMQFRDQHPDCFADVMYRDTVKAPFDVIEKVYAFIGMVLTDEARAAMHRWREDNKRENREAHEYTLQQFGFTEDGLKAQFANYRARYIDAG
jgi:hypothetical protein